MIGKKVNAQYINGATQTGGGVLGEGERIKINIIVYFVLSLTSPILYPVYYPIHPGQ